MTRLRSDKLYGFAFPGKESGLFGHFFELHAMAGGRMFEDEGPPAPRLDEAGHWALGLLKDLYERAAPPETPGWHYDEVAACFREGRAAMSTDWPGGFYTYLDPEQSAVVDRFDVALYPEGSSGAPHILELAHLRHPCQRKRPSSGYRAPSLPDLAGVAGLRGQPRDPSRTERLPARRPFRGRPASRTALESAGEGAGDCARPAQARELPRGRGRHLGGYQGGASG